NVVDTHAGAADDAQFRGVFEQRIVHLHGRAHHQRVGFGKRGGQTIGQLIVRLHFPSRLGANTASVAGDTFSAKTIFIAFPFSFCPLSYSSKRMPSCSQSRSNMRSTAACGLPSPFSYLVSELGCTPSRSAIWYW